MFAKRYVGCKSGLKCLFSLGAGTFSKTLCKKLEREEIFPNGGNLFRFKHNTPTLDAGYGNFFKEMEKTGSHGIHLFRRYTSGEFVKEVACRSVTTQPKRFRGEWDACKREKIQFTTHTKSSTPGFTINLETGHVEVPTQKIRTVQKEENS